MWRYIRRVSYWWWRQIRQQPPLLGLICWAGLLVSAVYAFPVVVAASYFSILVTLAVSAVTAAVTGGILGWLGRKIYTRLVAVPPHIAAAPDVLPAVVPAPPAAIPELIFIGHRYISPFGIALNQVSLLPAPPALSLNEEKKEEEEEKIIPVRDFQELKIKILERLRPYGNYFLALMEATETCPNLSEANNNHHSPNFRIDGNESQVIQDIKRMLQQFSRRSLGIELGVNEKGTHTFNLIINRLRGGAQKRVLQVMYTLPTRTNTPPGNDCAYVLYQENGENTRPTALYAVDKRFIEGAWRVTRVQKMTTFAANHSLDTFMAAFLTTSNSGEYIYTDLPKSLNMDATKEAEAIIGEPLVSNPLSLLANHEKWISQIISDFSKCPVTEEMYKAKFSQYNIHDDFEFIYKAARHGVAAYVIYGLNIIKSNYAVNDNGQIQANFSGIERLISYESLFQEILKNAIDNERINICYAVLNYIDKKFPHLDREILTKALSYSVKSNKLESYLWLSTRYPSLLEKVGSDPENPDSSMAPHLFIQLHTNRHYSDLNHNPFWKRYREKHPEEKQQVSALSSNSQKSS